ncbi:hypothetical protein D3C76_1681030 [compost metagenome]
MRHAKRYRAVYQHTYGIKVACAPLNGAAGWQSDHQRIRVQQLFQIVSFANQLRRQFQAITFDTTHPRGFYPIRRSFTANHFIPVAH